MAKWAFVTSIVNQGGFQADAWSKAVDICTCVTTSNLCPFNADPFPNAPDPGRHPQAIVDDLATTRKAGAKYFHELFERPDRTLDGHVRRQLQAFFSKSSSVSREQLRPDALAEVEKWESMTPAEGTIEYDKARVRLVRDYLDKDKLEAEVKRGLITEDFDNLRAMLLEQSEIAHDGAEKSKKLRRAHKLYKRRTVAPLYNHDDKVITKAEKDERELDHFWGYHDASEEEGGVGLQEDEQAVSCAVHGESSDVGIEGEGVTLNTERFNADINLGSNTVALPYRLHPKLRGLASNKEEEDTGNACFFNDTGLAFRPR